MCVFVWYDIIIKLNPSYIEIAHEETSLFVYLDDHINNLVNEWFHLATLDALIYYTQTFWPNQALKRAYEQSRILTRNLYIMVIHFHVIRWRSGAAVDPLVRP